MPNGIYDWRVKGPQYLAAVGTVTLTGSPVTLLEVGLLRAGDANGDNVVNGSDFSILKGAFARACGKPDMMIDQTLQGTVW